MSRYHADGRPCRATVRSCPFGEGGHFEDYAAYEAHVFEQDLADMEDPTYSWTTEAMDEQAAYLEEQATLEVQLAEHDAYADANPGIRDLSPAELRALIADTDVSRIPDALPAPGQFVEQSVGGYAATNPDGDHASCFGRRGEAMLWAQGMEVAEEEFMEGHGLAIQRNGREVASVTPKYEQWILGTRDIDLNYRRVPRTIGVYDSEDEALQAYALGRR